jgi:endonuclease/exonuclease/phosphatase family metal-dependent hydrolase
LTHVDVLPASGGRRRWLVGVSLLFAALTLCILPGAADAKKKKDKIGVATYNLYLGSDLGPGTTAAQAGRTDLFADEVGFVLKDVLANDFATRAKTIAKDLIKRKVDLVGLQEAAFWKLQSPSDGSGLNPAAGRALNPVADYVQILLEELNKKAKTGKECKKQDIPKSKCFKGYTLVIDQKEADLEFLGDFDNDPGPNGTTFDVSNSAAFGAAAPAFWLQGNDDTGLFLGNPPNPACHDGVDNDGDGQTDWSGLAPAPATPDTDCGASNDGSEAVPGTAGQLTLPNDMNFDSHAYAPIQGGTTGFPVDPATGAGMDPVGPTQTECNSLPPLESNPSRGPAAGDDPDGMGGAPPFPFAGYDGDQDPAVPGSQVPVCLFHGIDGDLSLTMRDAIIKRKGAGVGTKNATSANFANKLSLPLFGGAATVNFTRGWTAVDAKVRGKSFRFVNTHLESESNGSIREDQAAELIAPGGPATAPTTVLVGDLNSDPTREPTNLPNGDGGSKIAIDRLLAAGFGFVTQTGLTTGGHGELLSDQGNTLGDGWIDHVLTNNPAKIKRSGNAQVIDTFANGLWNSDHGGVYVKIKGKTKKKK